VTTPFGSPVVPDVYETAIASHSSAGPPSAGSGAWAASSASYSCVPSRSPAPVYSLSQTSMTIGRRPCVSARMRSAGPIVGASSRSVIRTSHSQWLSCQAMSAASRRVLSVLRTALRAGTA
jgi:hypothetical protein